ncbi:MAG: hypothetical protein ACK4R8_08685 [Thiobacillus sp.]
MKPPVIRLAPGHKRLVYAVFALLWTSGALWLAFHYFFAVEGDFGPEPHPLEKWWLRLHGLAAMFALVASGSLAASHMRLAWTQKKNRATGLPMLAHITWLAATGYALYYFSTDANATWLPLLHWVAGLALPFALAVHLVAGRRRARRRAAPAHQPAARAHAATPSVNASLKARP